VSASSVTPASSAKVPPVRTRSPWRVVFERVTPFGSIAVLIAMVAVFAIVNPSEFWTSENLISILNDGSLLAIIAGGLTVVLISLDFDLSVGAMATLGGITLALLLQKHVALGFALVIVAALAAVVGLLNGLIVARLGVSAFIATLAMMTILNGLSTWWANGASVQVQNATVTNWATDKVAGVPVPVIVTVIWYLGLWFVLERTTIGRRLYVTGANREAARLGGVRVSRFRLGAFMTCSISAALAGILLTSKLFGAYQGGGDPFLLDAYGAVFLGAVTLRIGQFHIIGTIVGALILSVLSNGLTILSAPAYVTSLLKGVILIAAVAIAGTSGTLKRRTSR
jgi:ribose transport system permease protein